MLEERRGLRSFDVGASRSVKPASRWRSLMATLPLAWAPLESPRWLRGEDQPQLVGVLEAVRLLEVKTIKMIDDDYAPAEPLEALSGACAQGASRGASAASRLRSPRSWTTTRRLESPWGVSGAFRRGASGCLEVEIVNINDDDYASAEPLEALSGACGRGASRGASAASSLRSPRSTTTMRLESPWGLCTAPFAEAPLEAVRLLGGGDHQHQR